MRAPLVWRLRQFARNEDGNVTIEAVLWMPVFLFALMLITDASLAFFGRAQAFRVIESGNRLYSIEVFDEETEVEAWIKARYAPLSTKIDVDTTVADGIVSTEMKIPARELVVFNTLNVLTNWKIIVTAQQYVEW